MRAQRGYVINRLGPVHEQGDIVVRLDESFFTHGRVLRTSGVACFSIEELGGHF